MSGQTSLAARALSSMEEQSMYIVLCFKIALIKICVQNLQR